VATRADDIATLYAEERATLARSTARLVGVDQAEDLVHDAFVTYLARPPQADRPGAWLSRVTRNRALNELRRARVISLDEDIPSDSKLGARAEADAVRAVLAQALLAMPDRYRTALDLRFLQECDYPEVADALGVSVAQAHVVLHRATRRLGRELVRRLAEPHNATACIPSIEAALGFTAEATEHIDGACAHCAPVLDELSALRALPALTPAIGLLQRLSAWMGSRAPALADPAGKLATLALAFGLAVAPFSTRPVSRVGSSHVRAPAVGASDVVRAPGATLVQPKVRAASRSTTKAARTDAPAPARAAPTALAAAAAVAAPACSDATSPEPLLVPTSEPVSRAALPSVFVADGVERRMAGAGEVTDPGSCIIRVRSPTLVDGPARPWGDLAGELARGQRAGILVEGHPAQGIEICGHTRGDLGGCGHTADDPRGRFHAGDQARQGPPTGQRRIGQRDDTDGVLARGCSRVSLIGPVDRGCDRHAADLDGAIR